MISDKYIPCAILFPGLWLIYLLEFLLSLIRCETIQFVISGNPDVSRNFMSRLYYIIFLILILSETHAQSILYYPKDVKYTQNLVAGISYENEITRIDSFCTSILADTINLIQFSSKQGNGETKYYWRGKQLLCAISFYKDTLQVNVVTTNKVEWFFEDNHAILMRQTVKYLATGKFYTRDKYYFNRYAESGVAQHMLFAWRKFGKRIVEYCDEFEKVNSSLPFQGQRVFSIASQLNK